MDESLKESIYLKIPERITRDTGIGILVEILGKISKFVSLKSEE